MSLLATAKNNVAWFRRTAEAHGNAVERYTHLQREAEEAARMWESVVLQIELDEKPN